MGQTVFDLLLFKHLVSFEDVLPSIGHGLVYYIKSLKYLLKAIAAATLIKLVSRIIFKAISAHVKCKLVLQPSFKKVTIHISAILKVSIIV